MAISVLPGALDNLCVRVADGSELWKNWYENWIPEKGFDALQTASLDNLTDSTGENGSY